MSTNLRTLRILVFVAGCCLVANDVARLLFPDIQQALIVQVVNENEQDESNPASAFSFFEEEVKHSDNEHFHHLVLPEGELEAAVVHLIKDDDVRHLAYIAIFSPPPDLA